MSIFSRIFTAKKSLKKHDIVIKKHDIVYDAFNSILVVVTDIKGDFFIVKRSLDTYEKHEITNLKKLTRRERNMLYEDKICGSRRHEEEVNDIKYSIYKRRN